MQIFLNNILKMACSGKERPEHARGIVIVSLVVIGWTKRPSLRQKARQINLTCLLFCVVSEMEEIQLHSFGLYWIQ